MTWTLVVPVKHTADGKSRLEPFIGPRRPELAHAMTLDTVQAALAASHVTGMIAVTNDPELSRDLVEMGVRVLPDQPDQGLNPALRRGVEFARQDRPEHHVAAMSSDLPALRAAELDRALAVAAEYPRAFVPDAQGVGTTLYAAAPRAPFEPRFGVDSASAHRSDGAIELTLPGIATLRRDVDVEQDLEDAIGLGIGHRTGQLLARVGALV